MKINNNRRKKEMALFIGAISLALSVILLGGTGAFGQTLTTLHDFGANMDGQNPQAGVVFDQLGNLYGTTIGGVNGNGIVYSLTPPEGGGAPWTESVLHKFAGQPDGAVPVSSLTISPSGGLFGTTEEGGAHNMGTVFGVKPPQNPGGPWRERALYSFGSSATDGVIPNAELLPANPGFYGVTREGGAHGFGTVFLVTPQAGGGGDWSETILYSFAGSGDAAFPSGGLVADQAGNLYGVTLLGGANNLGAVYQLSPPTTEGGSWTETVIFSFSGPDGTLPSGQLQFDQTGALYGTTDGGGSLSEGTVFQLTPSSHPGAPWTQTVLYSFSGGSPDGGNPVAGVKIDNMGRLFGTASTGGAGQPFPGGVIFKLTPPANQGDPWTETVLHAFGGPDGFRSLSLLVLRSGGFYGTTSLGGLNGTGTVFVLTP
jgi:uncharacterized repeat protein (TIGR03803 family)